MNLVVDLDAARSCLQKTLDPIPVVESGMRGLHAPDLSTRAVLAAGPAWRRVSLLESDFFHNGPAGAADFEQGLAGEAGGLEAKDQEIVGR